MLASMGCAARTLAETQFSRPVLAAAFTGVLEEAVK